MQRKKERNKQKHLRKEQRNKERKKKGRKEGRKKHRKFADQENGCHENNSVLDFTKKKKGGKGNNTKK